MLGIGSLEEDGKDQELYFEGSQIHRFFDIVDAVKQSIQAAGS